MEKEILGGDTSHFHHRDGFFFILREAIVCIVVYVINYGLGVVGPETTMDFCSTKWNRCLVRGLSMDNPLLILGTVKNSPGLLVGPRMVHVCCK